MSQLKFDVKSFCFFAKFCFAKLTMINNFKYLFIWPDGQKLIAYLESGGKIISEKLVKTYD